ncbi:MAG: hypothetical protein CLLPBCKN_007567 [Chroococcidiopsis cubana SAG 39.79]|uniref:Uncharacterized protein n=2 Tax=Chroococcidiopsis TaxID=54298 RepID=A0AB37UT63_9CYAN|nr:hypothetical protein [Chroococcidiopsis cubana]MDZ4878132.1 hypothetical protein [Chroococcidiopsis cubana SAG 39.79]PSB65773.1 hypothetical protein C7B79_03915 [Chroococcidiopsis cubana CCALA 043]RUT14599.1 hypothetical protein DSM107010_01450 [Chroococcidiopsis cubana SAG 39.79]
MKLRAWLQYSDREKPPYNPTKGTTITIEGFWQNESSEFDSLDWRREEWLIHSALVPAEQLNMAACEIASPHDLTFEMGWNSKDRFSFGDYSQYGEIQLYALAQLVKHPISQDFSIELSREFVTYHALQKRNPSQYYHPIDNILVAETNLDSHKTYDPTARVIIHRDYLRDFLAALGMGLLISVIAERFANVAIEEALKFAQIEDEKIDEFTWISTNIHTPEFTRHDYFRGRSTIRRNFIIEPYDRPKFERSPWYYFGEKLVQESELPSFIVNDEGKRQPLPKDTYLGNYINSGIGNFGYLYFRPEVLQKYLHIPGYSVFFHMRNWGVASLPGDRGTIDVGINSQGLVNAFAPDIADLSLAEQAYWASFSSLPSGEICEEMFQTRMQQNPPHSPGVVDLIRDARSQLNAHFKHQVSIDLFSDTEPSKQELRRLSVGPVSNQFIEVLELAKLLYEWVIETMQIEPLRNTLSALGGAVDKNLRQIKLLEKILMAKGLNETQTRSIAAPLVSLNKLRIGSAHIGSPELEPVFQLMGASTMPETPRAGWSLCVETVVNCLCSIADTLQT